MEACDPNARAFPLLVPPHGSDLQIGSEPIPDESIRFGITDGWSSVVSPEDLFYALIATQFSPAYLLNLQVPLDGFPGVPVPGNQSDFERAAELGRQLADLVDPLCPVAGITSGSLDDRIRDVGEAVVGAESAISVGTRTAPGRWLPEDGGRVHWSTDSYWRGISDEIWGFRMGGFAVIPKWLSYRWGQELSAAEIGFVQETARRIGMTISLHEELDQIYASAASDPLVTPG